MIINGDCLEELKKMPDNSADSVVTDPPYELGFMGKSWDNTGIAYKKDLWAEVLRVLKPGGHLLSFGGSRTYHRMACAIEDAGFEIRDQIMWVYGSGFPKSLNIGKAVDKLQGNEREVIGERPQRGRPPENAPFEKNTSKHPTEILTKGTSEWEGWGTALKPAHEPIVLARKPLSEKTVALNVLKWGVGGVNVDGCRVEYQSEKDKDGAKWGNQTGNVNDYGKGVGAMGMGGGQTPCVGNNARIRRLTPREAERLMGLPDDWLKWGIDEKGNKFEISDSQKYKMAGNGVVVNVIEALAKEMLGGE